MAADERNILLLFPAPATWRAYDMITLMLTDSAAQKTNTFG